MTIEYGPHFTPRGLRNATDYIVVHCSAGPVTSSAEAIVRYHMLNLKWQSCGYNDVIESTGIIVPTLHQDAIGAHIGDVKQVGNSRAYGICLTGGVDHNNHPVDNFTKAQKNALRDRLNSLVKQYPTAEIVGHRDLIKRHGARPKDCPCFDVKTWWYENMSAFDIPDRKPIQVFDNTHNKVPRKTFFDWIRSLF